MSGKEEKTSKKINEIDGTEKNLQGMVSYDWDRSTPLYKSMYAGIEHYQSSGAEKVLKGMAGYDWNRLTPLYKSMYAGIEHYQSSGAEKVLEGMVGYDWDHLAPTGSKMVAERDTLFRSASIEFNNCLSELPKHYSYITTEKNDGKEFQLALVSEQSKTEIPSEDLENAFGVMKLLKEITSEEMVDFVTHLYTYPMLALEHKIGRLIREAVKSLTKNIQISGSFYRCRSRKSDEMPWAADEMWEAPTGKSSQGRFNPPGNGLLYLSRNPATAVAETKQPKGTLLDIMEISFESESEIKVVDITNLELILFRFCMYKASGNSVMNKEYLVPNFLSQCCQMEKVHAIKYKSVFDHEVSNYVFLDYMKEWFNYQSSSSKRI